MVPCFSFPRFLYFAKKWRIFWRKKYFTNKFFESSFSLKFESNNENLPPKKVNHLYWRRTLHALKVIDLNQVVLYSPNKKNIFQLLSWPFCVGLKNFLNKNLILVDCVARVLLKLNYDHLSLFCGSLYSST
jgi:hypothetical protein